MFDNIHAVIFDFDNTLYSNKFLPIRLIASLPKDILKISADRKVRKSLKGCDFEDEQKYLEEYFLRVSNTVNISEEEARKWYFDVYIPTMSRVLRKKYSARSQANEVIETLNKNNVKIAIFSDYPDVEQKMKDIKLSQKTIDSVNGIYSAQDFGSLKPAPRPFLQIAKDLQVEPCNCLVVGDRDDTDGEGARKAGMEFIQIKTHKTKVKEPNHPLWTWQDFATWVLQGMNPIQD